jgi:hypothetical protein
MTFAYDERSLRAQQIRCNLHPNYPEAIPLDMLLSEGDLILPKTLRLSRNCHAQRRLADCLLICDDVSPVRVTSLTSPEHPGNRRITTLAIFGDLRPPNSPAGPFAVSIGCRKQMNAMEMGWC